MAAKYLSMLIVMFFLWLQTTQSLLAQDVPNSDESQSHHIYLPVVNSDGNDESATGELPREANTIASENVASSVEEMQRDANTTVTDTVQTAAHALYWTRWVSEENGGPPAYCQQWNEGAVGAGCSGSYCDNVRLLCETFPYGITLDSSTNRWTGFFSEEESGLGSVTSAGWYRYDGSTYEVCHRSNTGGIVQGIRCSGRYCDNISLECSVPVRWVNGVRDPATMTNCSWSGWYSEEQGSKDFGSNRYITGVKCSGRYCDNKQYYVCSLAP
jgi:hypothetical protein